MKIRYVNHRIFRKMAAILLMAGLLSLMSSCASGGAVLKYRQPQNAIAGLQRQIDQVLRDSLLAQTRVGIKVVSLKTGEVLYDRNSRELFHPASTMKLLTTATALQHLGPAYRFRTLLLADSLNVRDSTLQGDLYLKGFGDPELTSDDLRHLLDELKFRGIRHVAGNLVFDDSFFDDLYWGSGWMWDDVGSIDFAPISALSVNDNCVTVFVSPGRQVGDSLIVRLEPPTSYMKIENHGVTVDSTDSVQMKAFKVEREWKIPENTVVITGGMPVGAAPEEYIADVVDAGKYTATLFSELMRENRFVLDGEVVRGTAPDSGMVLAEHRSEPLAVVVYHTNKTSDNLSAEQMLKTLAAEVKGPPGTDEKGITLIHQYLQGVGIDSTSYEVVDGSGVSRYDVIMPALLTALLTDMNSDVNVRAEFEASLPIAALDGTLKNRMAETAAAQKLRAKTGTLRGVSALAGYTTSADGEPIAFAIMMEHFVVRTAAIRNVQDRIGDILSSFSRKRPPVQ